MKRLHFKVFSIVILLLLFSVTKPLYGAEANGVLSLTKLELNEQLKNNPDYEDGKTLYPDFFPQSYLRKDPDITFIENDITNIVINKGHPTTQGNLVFLITVCFNQDASKRLEKYTEKNINNYIAVRLNRNVLCIEVVTNKTNKGIRIPIENKTATEVKNLLGALSTKITDERDKLPEDLREFPQQGQKIKFNWKF